jgi:hypothetical protein
MKFGILVFCFAVLYFFSGCKKGELLGEFFFTEEMIESVPFNGTETLIYINQNDTIIFSGEYRQRKTNKVLAGTNTNDYYYTQSDVTKYKSSNGSIYISMYSDTNNSYSLGITWDETYGTSSGSGVAGFKLPLAPANQEFGQIFLDDLLINGINYKNVYGDTTVISNGSDTVVVMYYSLLFGLLKIGYQDGTAWDLASIIW